MSEPTRPTVGAIVLAEGDRIPVRFIETGDPGVFTAVTEDGEPAMVSPGDRIEVDVLGPGQSISFATFHELAPEQIRYERRD